MSYYIDIIDQVLFESLFVIEQASRSSIVLNWGGSDKKDDLSIVGSSLTFNFAHSELVDGKFIKLFTGNEVRFKVELRKSVDDSLVWTGYVVPDLYSEPYTNSVTFVDFTASCGLGRLKGKYLPDDYYRDEKSVIDILCKILSLTRLGLDVYFNPAIENSLQKNWDLIYLDSAYFFTDDNQEKKQDSYSILEKILQDTLCVCYQADNRWNIEGINKRHVRGYNAKLYSSEGILITQLSGQKLLKKITPLVTPFVTMIPPYNMITVTHKRIPQDFPKTIAKEDNDGWSVMPGVEGEIYSTDWNGNGGFYSVAIFPDYVNAVLKEYYIPPLGGIPIVSPFDEEKFINLKNKIYLYKYQKVTISASFTIIKYLKDMSTTDPNAFINPLLYQILFNDEVIFSNRKDSMRENEKLLFVDGNAELLFDWIVPFDGLLDVKFWRSGTSIYETNILGVGITKLSITPVKFEENYVVSDIISDEFTIDKEIELDYSDDDTAFSKGFRLAKLKEATIHFNTILIPISYSFSQNGKFYSVVSLKGANLIKDNINTVNYQGSFLQNLEVIYNYNASEQMVVETDFAIASGNFSVNVYKNNDIIGSRSSWLQWTDSVYKIESDRYQKTVCNILRRMFNESSEKLDVVALNAVKFNDLILFDYVDEKQFVPINCSWDLDGNKTTLTLARSVYRDSGDSGLNPENIPPIVNAGLDIIIEDGQSSVSVTAMAYDVDGYIIRQNWVKTIGGFGDIISSPSNLTTNFENLTEDHYQYKIEVVDNDGATAFDLLNITRRKNYTAILDLIHKEGDDYVLARYKFVIDPNIPADNNLLLKGRAYLFAYNHGDTRFKIFKNGVLIYVIYGNSGAYEDLPFSVGYLSTDEIIFEIFQSGGWPTINMGSSWIDFNSVDFINGSGKILGVPHRYQPVIGGV